MIILNGMPLDSGKVCHIDRDGYVTGGGPDSGSIDHTLGDFAQYACPFCGDVNCVVRVSHGGDPCGAMAWAVVLDGILMPDKTLAHVADGRVVPGVGPGILGDFRHRACPHCGDVNCEHR
jgi:hypothetical protein